MKKSLIFLIIFVLTTLALMMFPIIEAEANSGPPSNLDLTVVYDNHLYDLEILIHQETPLSEDQITQGQYLIDEPEMMGYRYFKDDFPQVLVDFQDKDGYVSNTLYGDVDYFWGEHMEGESEGHYVMMLNVPRVFKIALVDQHDQIIISELITMESYDYQITWDLTGIVFDDVVQYDLGLIEGLNINPWLDYRHYLQMTVRLIVSLLIEGGIFYLFGFRKKWSYLILLGLNVVTQFILTFVLVQALFEGMQGYGTFFVFIFSEFFIFIGEMLIITVFVKELRWWRRLGFAFLANTASLIFGLIITSWIGQLLV